MVTQNAQSAAGQANMEVEEEQDRKVVGGTNKELLDEIKELSSENDGRRNSDPSFFGRCGCGMLSTWVPRP